MGDFDDAVRRLAPFPFRCPKCDVENVPGRAPIVTRKPSGQMGCDQCGHDWWPPKDDAR